ncbi:RNA polymerase sigma factor WhiG [Gottschalkia purinilytica]|uniref:RNA polymerase sigma factor WhiG n=1 Tax=Gottschalkia purinilytica TaxID=1503 RepID=A0A0L0WBT8_GOTPU|nr:FliA/WhiG family RNA polymerase sigma factor [Gottschalkia purinilytica]KNF08840.1 RNA polymerase sigma factor WhiG [Gottschalkia purinilytica]
MTTEELWKMYKETNEQKYKQDLIVKYVSLVKIIAGRMYNFYAGNIEYDDLLGFGVFGLIDAIEKFDLTRDLKFETYAQIRIRGAIIDNLRKLDWVPRRIRKKSKEIEKVINILENRLGRSVTNQEIADEMKISLKEIEETLSEISTLNVISLEETLTSKGEASLETGTSDNPEKVYENKEIKKVLSETINLLSEREKLVVSMYYFNELTYKEIGTVLNLSESRISQIHSKAIITIKNSLNKLGIHSY